MKAKIKPLGQTLIFYGGAGIVESTGLYRLMAKEKPWEP